MILNRRKFILLLPIICLILGQIILVDGFAWSENTLSPVAVVSNLDFQKAFDDNSQQAHVLENRVSGIERVYSMITEEDAYPGFTGMLDLENNYQRIGTYLVSDIKEVNKIVNILPVDENTQVCELGSGIGNVSALFAARGANVIGYEIDQKLVWLSNNIARIDLNQIIAPERLRFERANFLNKDLSKFDIVFYYWNSMLLKYKDDLQGKILKELKPGALLVLYGVSKDEEYFPGLEEVTALPGYETINYNARIYAQSQKTDKPIVPIIIREKSELFRDDLDSIDAEVRLQAALVLAKRGKLDDKAYAIICQSAVNKNLTLNDRVRAAKFLRNEELWEYKGQLINDKQHFARIEQGDKNDFESLEIVAASLEQVQEQIKNISGIDQQTAEDLIALSNDVEFLNNELAVLSNAIKYFEVNWRVLIEKKLDREYGYDKSVIDQMLDDDLAGVQYINSVDYVKAYLVSQKIISEFRHQGVLFMSGDREWFVLEAFQRIYLAKYAMEQTKEILESRWKKSTAASRAKDIFKGLDDIGLSPGDFMSEIKIEFFANTARQFIYRGYDDGGYLEYAAGPNYDSRNISIGVENNVGEVNALHINLGVSWASKYIWAAYLAMHDFIDSKSFPKGFYDYSYDQQIKEDNQLFADQRRVSYIGVWTKELDDIEPIIDIFVPLSIGLNSYLSGANSETGEIWKNFRLEFEKIISSQDDQQLKAEFFDQARMVRFVELMSVNNRDNSLFTQVRKLITNTISQLNHALAAETKNKSLLGNSPDFLLFLEAAISSSI